MRPIGKCAKQEVIAIIVNKGRYWIGSNWCWNSQEECPREGMKTGEGYHLCKEVCRQIHHAETDALQAAGPEAKDATMYIIGHTRVCDRCAVAADKAGIKEIIIGKLPAGFIAVLNHEAFCKAGCSR